MGQFIDQTLEAVATRDMLNEHQPLAGFVDVDGVRNTIDQLHQAFPDHFHHAFAAKANTMSECLRLVRSAGMGCEVASRGELNQALAAGFEPSHIVYDEPAKLPYVIQQVLARGVSLNIDNFQEFERVRKALNGAEKHGRLGFRINPQVGAGKIGAMSTATLSSKFGVALEDEGTRERLLQLYSENSWLTSLHSHVGSQGVPLELMVLGIRKIVDLALAINKHCGRQQVELIDIGGGLPVNFSGDEVTPSFSDFAQLLREGVPELFDGSFQVKTEYGRTILAKNGFIASRVEYTKQAGGRRIVITHAGAQVATRTVFMPKDWAIRLSLYGPNGLPRNGDVIEQDFAGPLCFAGDMIGTERKLPAAEPGDIVVLHDTGAYYFSNPFFYNALPACAVYGIEGARNGKLKFNCWREQQTIDETLAVIG